VDYETCYEILGIEPGATLRQIHAAYKKLALKHHPDRAPDDPRSHRVFIRVTEAYSILKSAHRAGRSSSRAIRPTRSCPRCHRFAELFKSLDGGRYCAECLLGRRRKFLPLPIMEVIRCVGVMVLQTAALGFLVTACIGGDRRYFGAAAASCIAAMGLMAYHVWSADVIEQ
jgi:hypothetical protein